MKPAARTAYASLKHSYEKVGDHWEPKEERGPSDERAAQGRDSSQPTAGGVDANASKAHLYKRAQEMNIRGRSKMDKDELVEALQKANDAATRKARGRLAFADGPAPHRSGPLPSCTAQIRAAAVVRGA